MSTTNTYTIDGYDFVFSTGWIQESGVTITPETARLDDQQWLTAFKKAVINFPMVDFFHSLMEAAHGSGQFDDLDDFNDAYLSDVVVKWAALLELGFMPHVPEIIEIIDSIKAEIDRREQKIRKTRKSNLQSVTSTRPGFVYLLRSTTSNYKIGRTSDPSNRLKTFAVKLPFEVEFDCLIQTNDMIGLESDLHQRFASKHVNGEWFALDDTDVAAIKALAGQSS